MVKIVIDVSTDSIKTEKEMSIVDQKWESHDIVVCAMIKKLKSYRGVEAFRIDNSKAEHSASNWRYKEKSKERNADVYVTINYGSNIASKKIDTDVTAIGEKRLTYYVIWNTEYPIIFTDVDFSDTLGDIIKLRGNSFLQSEGESIAEEIANHIKLQPMTDQFHSEKKITPEELISAATIVLRHLETDKKGVVPQKWMEKINEGTLGDSDAIALLYVVLHQWLMNK